MNLNCNTEKTKKEKQTGMNYRIVVPHLTEKFKEDIINNKKHISDYFEVSENTVNYIKKLICKEKNVKFSYKHKKINFVQKLSKLFNIK